MWSLTIHIQEHIFTRLADLIFTELFQILNNSISSDHFDNGISFVFQVHGYRDLQNSLLINQKLLWIQLRNLKPHHQVQRRNQLSADYY